MSQKKNKRGLTPKQDRFVREYLVDLNATQAAIRAGYSPDTAAEQGYQLVHNTSVSAEISKRQEKINKRLDVSAERVIEELSRLAFSNIADFVEFGEFGIRIKDTATLNEDDQRCIAAVSESVQGRKFTMHDKKGALDSLAKYFNLFERHQQSGSGQINIYPYSEDKMDEYQRRLRGEEDE